MRPGESSSSTLQRRCVSDILTHEKTTLMNVERQLDRRQLQTYLPTLVTLVETSPLSAGGCHLPLQMSEPLRSLTDCPGKTDHADGLLPSYRKANQVPPTRIVASLCASVVLRYPRARSDRHNVHHDWCRSGWMHDREARWACQRARSRARLRRRIRQDVCLKHSLR